jgi:restriction system protein
MTRRRDTGVFGALTRVQQQQRRRQEAEERARVQAQRDRERQERENQRLMARDARAARQAYQQLRDAEAAERTAELDARVAEIRSVLQSRLSVPEFDVAALRRAVESEGYDVQVDRLVQCVAAGDQESVEEFFGVVLLTAPAWPSGFPFQLELAWDKAGRQVVVEYQLPDAEVVPAVGRVRYAKADDRDVEVARSVGDRREAYRDVIAQTTLRVMTEIFRADRWSCVDSVAFTGCVDAVDPATGREAMLCLVSASVLRTDFSSVALDRVDAVACLEALGGVLSARPDKLAVVREGRAVNSVPSSAPLSALSPVTGSSGGAGEPDLFEMDPIEFEELIASLFSAMGLQVTTTARSGDEGVDVVAEDLDPVRGGKIVIQAKRYRRTVPPTAVRDLVATVQHHGAIKGILITTAGFGPGSHEFIRNKPVTLISGPELVDLLNRHGLPGRLGGGPGSSSGILARLSAGSEVPLDPCAFVCSGGRVLSDEHFVFYNNEASPEDAVRLGDGVAYLLDFDLLPAEVDRVVLAASSATAGLDLTELRDAEIHLLDQAEGTELATYPVVERGPGQDALVFGSFVRQGEQWAFKPSLAGSSGGLLGLAVKYGVDVE